MPTVSKSSSGADNRLWSVTGGFTGWLEKHLQGIMQEYVILPGCREMD